MHLDPLLPRLVAAVAVPLLPGLEQPPGVVHGTPTGLPTGGRPRTSATGAG